MYVHASTTQLLKLHHTNIFALYICQKQMTQLQQYITCQNNTELQMFTHTPKVCI